MKNIVSQLYRLGPLAPIAAFFLSALLLFLTARLAIIAVYYPRLNGVEGFWWVLPTGLRMDVITLSILLLIPAMLVLLLPHRLQKVWRPVIAAVLAGMAGLMIFLEVATFPFVAQYDSRPNRIFIEYLVYPKEVSATIWADYKFEIVLALVLVFFAVRYTWRAANALIIGHRPWSYGRRLVILPLVMLLFVMGGRSSFGHRAANISTAAISNDHLTNEIALNSTYSVSYAIYALQYEEDESRLYGEMPLEEVYQRVAAQMSVEKSDFVPSDVPFLHRQVSAVTRERPYNLVVFLQESLGAEYVGRLGGLPLTPNIDRLAGEGLFFTNLYATGTRTVRGIEAIVSGFLPTPGRSVVKLGRSQHNFFTVAQLLKQHGYATEFIYGGESHFDNMRSFFLGNGFDRIIDEPNFPDAEFRGTWGVSDEDLVRKANRLFVEHGEKPFFALMLSTTNHAPFEFPDGRIELYEEPKNTVHNAMKFADYAVGLLFDLAKKESYFKNTVFLIVADHNTRVYGADLVPVRKFHIPGLIIAPGMAPGVYDKVASQIDLMPTVLGLLGIHTLHPMIGRDLLELPEQTPGRAFMQYGLANAYLVGDRVVVHQPSKPPSQFLYVDGRLTPEEISPNLVADAMAHIQLPSNLYQKQKYHLP